MNKGLFYFLSFSVIISLAMGMFYAWEHYGVFEFFAKFKEQSNSGGNSLFSQASDTVKNLISGSFSGGDFKLVKQIPLASLGSNDDKDINILETPMASSKDSVTGAVCHFQTTKHPVHQTIFINELAWMGGVDSANNEWIELKNISDKTADISGWQLLDKDEQINVVFAAKTMIAPAGFFVLERNEDAIPKISADYLYTGNLRNDDEGLRLFDEKCNLIDEAIATKSWPAGENQTKKTMERNLNDLSWHTSENIGGTPRKENPIPQPIFSPLVTINNTTTTSSVSSLAQAPLTAAVSPIIATSTAAATSTPVVCSQENLNSPLHSVLINEVAWAGGSSSNGLGSADEWIELKNIGNQSINLDDWRLLNKSANVEINFGDQDILNSDAYYLLERTDDDSVPGIEADKFFTNAILNSDESLRLFDQNCQLIDEVIANPDWPGGNSDEYRTAERLSDLSWQTYYGSAENGVLGTPKKVNSSPSSGGGVPTSPSPEPPSPPPSPPTSSIVISEIMAGIDGNANYEFIELYNQTASPIDLTGWNIKKRNSSGNESSLVVSSRFEGKIIAPNKYFLIVNESGYTGSVLADIVWPSSYTLAYTSNALVVYDGQNSIIEELNWTEIPKNQSWERNLENNQFQIQPNPNPQNSQNN